MSDILTSAWTLFWTFLERFVNVYILANLHIIGWIIIISILALIIGRLVKVTVVKSLSILGFRRLSKRTWAESVLKVTGYHGSIVELLGDLFKWLVYILALASIIHIIGLPGLAELFNQIGWFMPRFIGAIILLVMGFIIADFFGKVFEEAGRVYLREDFLAAVAGGVARYIVGIIIVIMSLSMIGIDSLSLNIMFFVILAAFAGVLLLGLKDIFPEFTAGISLKSIHRIGQHIEVGGHSGVIEGIGLTSVCIREGNKKVYLPNTMLLKGAVSKIEKRV